MRISWKALAILALTIAMLVGGVTAVLAQDEEPSPPFARGFVDEDGDGVCDTCGQIPGSGFGMMGAYGMRGVPWAPRGTMANSSLIALLADQLDSSVAEIQAELATGTSIAQFAADNGLDVASLIETVLAQREEALGAAVDAGWLSAERAEWMLEHMAEEINEHVEESWNGPRGFGAGGCHGGGFGPSSGFGGMRSGGGFGGSFGGGGMMRGFGAGTGS
ncbi:MAG: hypothetical protein R3300_01355 [Candidatus Promineifilaceae bacterium]|nr:hypothetical protein [Candidatus Promineifilaceae bacterium]